MPRGYRSNGTKLGFQKREKHFNWKGEKHLCIICGKEVSFYSKKCKKCYREDLIKRIRLGKKHSLETKGKMSEFWQGKRLGVNNPHWKGGKINDGLGYVLIKNRKHPFSRINGYVSEHRLVVEEQIKRPLLISEPVHHLGKITDNRPFMLIAFKTKSAHHRFEHNSGNVKPEEIIFDGRKFVKK